MYAARAVPLGVVTAVAPFVAASDITTVRMVLVAAMAVQAVDASIGIRRREVAMIVGPSIAAIVHGTMAWYASEEGFSIESLLPLLFTGFWF